MFKKLSLLLAVVMLFTSMVISAPVSAQAATEENVLVESNFQNCNLGTYSAENQLNGETDLRNGVVMVDDSSLSAGYTIKNGSTYESISEADIVNDGGEKVLRLNTFLNTPYTWGSATYPVVKTTGKLPDSGKVKIDLELKMSPRVSFWMYHSVLSDVNWRIWRLENGGGSASNIRVLYNTTLTNNKQASCNVYNKFTVIMDTETYAMDCYLNGEYLGTVTGKSPANGKKLFFSQLSLNDASVKPTPVYNSEDNKKIESVTNPQYVYVKSLKMTTYTNTALESVTPANGSYVITPSEAVFTFNNTIKTIGSATVYSPESGETVDVKSSLVCDGKTIKVPYAFEEEKNYEVKLTGVSDGITSTDASTSFRAEVWKFSNLVENPVNSSPADNNTYYVNEDFTNSDDTNIVTESNKHEGWNVVKQQNASIVELDGGNKVLKLAGGSDFRLQLYKSLKHLDNTTTISYDVYLDKNVKQFNLDMETSNGIAMWQYGYFEKSGQENVPGKGPMTAGEWHKVDISVSDETGSKIYVDGKFVYNTPKGAVDLANVANFRFRADGSDVLLDNLRFYLNKGETALTAVAPAYGAADAKVSAPLAFTYNETIGDVSGAQLIVKPSDTNQAVVLTNGNGMAVNVENSTVKVILDEALKANIGYAVELSGLKDISGAVVTPVKTKFSTVADDSEWIMTDIDTEVSAPNSKIYSFKLKHQGEAEGAQFIAATYDADGSLSSVELSDAKTVGNSWTDFTAEAEYGADKSTKLFVWNSINGMAPIFDVILK